jgi:hypothetical protein
MKATCTEACAWYKKYKKGTRCPFYLETVWNNEDGTTKIVKDCSHKRAVLLAMEAHNERIGLHKAFNQQRNRTAELLDVIAKSTPETKYIDGKVEDDTKLIE